MSGTIDPLLNSDFGIRTQQKHKSIVLFKYNIQAMLCVKKYQMIFIIALISMNFGIMAQTSKDSLWNRWNDQNQTDTIRLNALDEFISKEVENLNTDSIISLVKLQYELARERDLLDYQAKTSFSLGEYYGSKDNYPMAINYYEKSLLHYKKVGDSTGISGCFKGIGLMYKFQGNYAQAIDYYDKGLKIEEERMNQGGTSGFLLNIGNIYLAQADYPTAIEYYKKCQKIKEEIQDTLGISYAVNNAGFAHYQLQDYDKAMEYYGKSLQLKESLGDKGGTANSLNNMGLVYNKRGDYDKAMEYYTKSLQIKEGLGDIRGTANGLNNIGILYREKGDYTKSIEFSKRGLAMAQEKGAIMVILDASRALYRTYKLVGNNAKALEMHELFTESEGEILSEQNQREVLRQQYRYTYERQALADSLDFAKKEAIKNLEIAKQDADLSKQRIGLAATGGGLILLIILAFSIRRGKKRSDELLHNILPEEVASELKQKGEAEAKLIDEVTILFTDFKGFTELTEQLSPKALVKDIHVCFSAFDDIMQKHGIEKIKTIGDAYMAAGGLPIPNNTHAKDVVMAALDIAEFVAKTKKQKIAENQPFFEIRIGVHTGPVVAGIVGVKKFSYDIWGDTVNTASRLESNGEEGKINISEATYNLIQDDLHFQFESRGEILVKGKGELSMWFVSEKH